MAEVLSAGAFATEGERRAAAELRKLPEPWLVICNKMVVTNDGRTYEVDFIVVGDRWVFVIDEKSWCGKITGNDQKWFRADNHSERSPLNKAEAIAKPLAGNLRACLGYQLHPERRQHVFTSFVFVHDLLAEPFHDPSTFQLQERTRTANTGSRHDVQREMGMVGRVLDRLQSVVQRGLQRVAQVVKRWTKPPSASPLLDTVANLARSKPELMTENLLLRQQLLVRNRSVKRPRVTPAERGLFVLLAGRLPRWHSAVLIVKPETILRWHRAGFQLFWKRKSRPRSSEPKIPVETIALIKEMAANNRLWGADRIQGALLKVGIHAAKRTIQRYMRQVRAPRPHGQTWATFLRNHATDRWACACLQLHDLFFRPLFAFVITELGSRRIVHVSVTRSPTDAWVAQHLREATPFGAAPK